MRRLSLLLLCFALCFALLAIGCGGSSGSNATATQPTNGTVNTMMSDASTEDWATIGVKVVSITLNPQGGGKPVTIYTASPAPVVNLVELDSLEEVLGNLPVTPGTYSSATLNIGANPGDVALVTSADPEPGFAGPTGAPIPAANIKIQGATGTTGSLTVPVTVNFLANLVVTAGQSSPLDVEFDLSNPALIIQHVSPSGTFWLVNFNGPGGANGPVRHHVVRDITKLVLRHHYGTVTAVSTDNTTMTITKDYPTEPPVSPETFTASAQSLAVLADGTNGTIFYNLDAGNTPTVINNFSTVSTLLTTGGTGGAGMFVRVAARYQQNGTLVATRIWASATFNKVFVSPEGHVLDVNTTTNILTVENEAGVGIPVTINGSTAFLFQGSAAPGLGLSNLHRGYKVHVDVVDPLAATLTAQTVNVEIARSDGALSSASPTAPGTFDYTHLFDHTKFGTNDDYTNLPLTYISTSTPNGFDNSGNQIDGFRWWYFAYPTATLEFGATGISAFAGVVNDSISFGTLGTQDVAGLSYATWNDPAGPSNWSALWTIILPTPAPLALVTTPASPISTGATFAMTVGGASVPVNLSNQSGGATLVYQVDFTNGVFTVTAQDITQPSVLTSVMGHLVSPTPVKVFGVPQSGNLKAYVVLYFTGTAPTS